MSEIEYLLIDLLHEFPIDEDSILADSFVESFGIDCDIPIQDRKLAITQLFKKELIYENSYQSLCLTSEGGKLWESKFLIDWNLYCELFTIGDYQYSYFYACDMKQIELFIQNGYGLLDHIEIQVAKDWQPIYWKKPFSGFYLKIPIDIEELDDIFKSMSKYNIRHEYLYNE